MYVIIYVDIRNRSPEERFEAKLTYDILSIISNHLKEYPYSLEVKENMCRCMGDSSLEPYRG